LTNEKKCFTLEANISNASIGKECGSMRIQRAAGWCEAARIPHEITHEQGAENASE
jgi:hypothetical protein